MTQTEKEELSLAFTNLHNQLDRIKDLVEPHLDVNDELEGWVEEIYNCLAPILRIRKVLGIPYEV